MGVAETLEDTGLVGEDVELELVYLAGVWLEAVLYGMSNLAIKELETISHCPPSSLSSGVYIYLFVASLPFFTSGNKARNRSATIIFIGNVLMFIQITVHLGEFSPFESIPR
jgi:hypothetical protein